MERSRFWSQRSEFKSLLVSCYQIQASDQAVLIVIPSDGDKLIRKEILRRGGEQLIIVINFREIA